MKRRQVENFLGQSSKRLKIIKNKLILIIILGIVSLLYIALFIYKNKPQYIEFNENSKLDYNVYLKDNEFFDKEYLKENNQYISTLMDKINANFEYNLNIDDDIKYNYDYYIEADVSVKDKETNKNLYNFKDILKTNNSYIKENKINISDSVDIDYNYYNDLIKKFVSVYDLKESYSILSVKMYVSVLGNCNDLRNKAVVSLEIPLNTQTVSINVNEDLIENNTKQVFCKETDNFKFVYLGLGILSSIIEILLIISFITFLSKTRTAQNIYERKLSKILNNYKSYIQKVNNDFSFSEYQLLKVDTFSDMLEIRDITQEPILMVENKNKTGVYFLIPSKTKILYCYGLKVNKIDEK